MRESKASKKQLTDDRRRLRDPYAHLCGDGSLGAVINGIETRVSVKAKQHCRSGSSASNRDRWIEDNVRQLHKMIWEKRNQFWPDGVPIDPVKLFEPSIASRCIGYGYELAEYLGEFHEPGSNSEIAGMIDRIRKRISISRRLPYNTLRFTSAHEMGHAMLHRGTLMHRDRPLDGSSKMHGSRDTIEIEADKFASLFLMPEKFVRGRFAQVFGVASVFVLTDDTAFALEPANPEGLINRCKTLRDLTRVLAKTEQYNGRHVNSLAAQFGVSVEAMAIRIEELGLAVI